VNRKLDPDPDPDQKFRIIRGSKSSQGAVDAHNGWRLKMEPLKEGLGIRIAIFFPPGSRSFPFLKKVLIGLKYGTT
jgi:hypothetical protein